MEEGTTTMEGVEGLAMEADDLAREVSLGMGVRVDIASHSSQDMATEVAVTHRRGKGGWPTMHEEEEEVEQLVEEWSPIGVAMGLGCRGTRNNMLQGAFLQMTVVLEEDTNQVGSKLA